MQILRGNGGRSDRFLTRRLGERCCCGQTVLLQRLKLLFQRSDAVIERFEFAVLLLIVGAEADQRHFQLHSAVAGARHAVAALPDGRERFQNGRERIHRGNIL